MKYPDIYLQKELQLNGKWKLSMINYEVRSNRNYLHSASRRRFSFIRPPLNCSLCLEIFLEEPPPPLLLYFLSALPSVHFCSIFATKLWGLHFQSIEPQTTFTFSGRLKGLTSFWVAWRWPSASAHLWTQLPLLFLYCAIWPSSLVRNSVKIFSLLSGHFFKPPSKNLKKEKFPLN